MENQAKTVSKSLNILGKKWTISILYNLCSNTARFGELQRNLSGISPKTLSVRLKELEKLGIVSKKIYPVVPLKVEYSLTKKGLSLKQLIIQIQGWGDKYI